MKAPDKRDRARINNLVELFGTETRCDCRKKGWLVKVGVSKPEPRLPTRYFAEWEHPEPDGESTAICEYVWP